MKELENWQMIFRRIWKKYKYFIAVIAVGVLLLTVSFPKQQTAQEQTTAQSSFDLTAFQKELAQSLSRIDGAGRVEVMLSLESGEESVFASNVNESTQSSDTSNSESYQSETAVVSDGSYGETPILIKNKYPAFRGAVILCEGADNSSVCLEITNAVTALCGISSDHVSISKLSE